MRILQYRSRLSDAEAAESFARHNNRIFERFDEPHLNIIIDDGRNHVVRTDQRYYVIISDATHPGTADSWVLYTEEFFRLCQQKLQQGGMMAQWLMLGTSDHMQIDYAQLPRRLQAPAARASLEAVQLSEAPDFLSALVLDENALAQFTGDGPTNTDDRPYISFSDRTRAGTSFGVPALASLLPFVIESVSDSLVEPDEDTVARLDRRFRARRHYLHGMVAFLERNRTTATAQLQHAPAHRSRRAQCPRILKRLRQRPRPSR